MITKDQIEHFAGQGYVVVEDVLDPTQDLLPVINDYAELLERLAARWHTEGRLKETYSELSFVHRLTRVLSESTIDLSRYFDISLPDTTVDVNEPMHLSEPIFRLITNQHLLDVVESFVGPEILSNPVQHVRIKPPEIIVAGKFEQNFLVRRTGWHQDQGVVRPDADETATLTVWLPIHDATEENGCLCVVPGSHRTGLTQHCPGPDGLIIPDRLLTPGAVPVPIKAGSVLCMHRLTMHSSMPNTSNTIRWSFDLRYQPIGQPTGRDEYPSFVARSQRHPDQVLTDYQRWAQLWHDARQRLAHATRRQKHRWPADAPLCA